MKSLNALMGLASALAAAVTLHGNAPLFEYHDLAENIDKTWQYEKAKYIPDKNPADPEIYFYAFDRAHEDTAWVKWQNSWIRSNPSIWQDWLKIAGPDAPKEVTPEWIDKHIDKIFPFPKQFRAFHYDGTNKIQIDPDTTFLPFFVNGPDGVKSDNIGFGYYTAAHELMHYTLEQLGIPSRIHHCLFITERPGKKTLMEDAAQFLIDQKISSDFVMFMGAEKEKELDPCGQLTDEQRALVERTLPSLP